MRKDKELTKIYAKKYYQEHKEIINQRAKDFYRDNYKKQTNV